jgi:hypothetical protein
MVPSSFHDFFVASAGAGAALVGLLFVAISIAPERTVGHNAPLEKQVLATSTFTAMLNAFFISLVALVPGINLGIITVIMGALAFVNSLTLGWYFLQRRRDTSKRTARLSSLVLVVVGLGLYGFEVSQGVQLMIQPSEMGIVTVLTSIIVAVYGLGLTRAWELLGAQRYSLLARISVMRELDEPVIGEEEAPGSAVSTTTSSAMPQQPRPQP